MLAELYRSVRLFVNFVQPSFKLIENGAMAHALENLTVRRRSSTNGWQPTNIPPMRFEPDCRKSASAWTRSRCCVPFGLRSNVLPT